MDIEAEKQILYLVSTRFSVHLSGRRNAEKSGPAPDVSKRDLEMGEKKVNTGKFLPAKIGSVPGWEFMRRLQNEMLK